MTERPPMQDPRTQYPAPPFPEQHQPAPGLAARMDPQPDHGEESYVGSGRLTGRQALITGGDSGIGRAAAIAFAREGADVAISYLSSEERDAEAVIDLIKAEGRTALGLPGDVKQEAWCRQLVEQAVEGLGGLDILVVNATRQQFRKDVGEVSTADFDATMKTDLYALHWISQAAVPHLPPGAAIITTASVQAYEPSPILLDYATTKAGIVAYTKALAKQVIKNGIRANIACMRYRSPKPDGRSKWAGGGQFAEMLSLGQPQVDMKPMPAEAAEALEIEAVEIIARYLPPDGIAVTKPSTDLSSCSIARRRGRFTRPK